MFYKWISVPLLTSDNIIFNNFLFSLVLDTVSDFFF